MIATVSNYSIDIEHLEAIYMDERGGDWGYFVILVLKPTMQYVKNPETNEWELHHANTIIEQPCIDDESMEAKYEHWVKLWQKDKDSIHEGEDKE